MWKAWNGNKTRMKRENASSHQLLWFPRRLPLLLTPPETSLNPETFHSSFGATIQIPIAYCEPGILLLTVNVINQIPPRPSSTQETKDSLAILHRWCHHANQSQRGRGWWRDAQTTPMLIFKTLFNFNPNWTNFRVDLCPDAKKRENRSSAK